jgi:guanylate kinase
LSIIIVGGPACAGKSTFIKKHFPDKTIIDLKSFQDQYPILTYEAVVKSYDDCREALVSAIKENKEVVLEHTLLRAIRRDAYIKAIREVTEDDIIIYFFKPSISQLKDRMASRLGFEDEENAIQTLNVLETPTFAEGYSKIYIIKDNNEIVEQLEAENAIKNFVIAVNDNDNETATKMFEGLLENEIENIPDDLLETISKYAKIVEDAEQSGALDEVINSLKV